MSESEINSNKVSLRAFAMLLMAIAIGGIGSSFDVVLVVKITEFYGITDSDFGLLLGLTTLVLAVASAPWGYWADRHQRVRLLLASTGIIFVCILIQGACFVWQLPYWVYFTAKLISGVGFAGIVPVTNSMVMDTIPQPQRGAAFGWMAVAFGGGGATSMLAAAGCMQMNLSLGVTYFLIAVSGGICFILLFAMKEPRRGSQEEALHDTVGAGLGEYCYHLEVSDLKALMAKPINLIMGAAVVFFQFPLAVLSVWFVTFLMRNHGFSELNAFIIMLLAFLGQPVGSVLGGVLADKALQWGPSGRLKIMILMALLSPLFMILGLALPFKLLWFIPIMTLANFFIIAGGPAFAAVSLEVNLPEHRGTISAYLAICTSVALGFAWLIPPLIADAMGGKYQLAMISTAAAYLPLIITYLLMRSRIVESLDHIKTILEERSRQIEHSQPEGGTHCD